MTGSGRTLAGRPLVAGEAAGTACVLAEPLSFWGGYDAATGTVVDAHHPQRGAAVAGHVLVLPAARGSSSSSSVLAEAARRGTAPVAIVLGAADGILAVGAVVADELYGVTIPIVVCPAGELSRIAHGEPVTVAADGTVTLGPSPSAARQSSSRA